MASLNRVMLIGNVGTDPEMRFTPSGNPVTSFRLATNRTFTGPDGARREETQWFSVIAWNKLAETCNQYLTKGKQVFVEGRLQTRSWDGQDGQRRFTVEVVANTVLFLGQRDSALPEEREAEDLDAEAIPFTEP